MSVTKVNSGYFLDDYDKHRSSFANADVAWLNDLRKKGKDAFLERGLPLTKVENWKYTKPKLLASETFAYAGKKSSINADVSTGLDIDAYNIYFVDGIYDAKRSSSDLPKGLTIKNIANCGNEASIKDKLGALVDLSSHAVAALNTAYINDGCYIELKEAVKLDKPVHLISIASKQNAPQAFYLRYLIVVGKNSSVALISSHIGADGAVCFSNSVDEIYACEGSELKYYINQDETKPSCHISYSAVNVEKGAKYEGFVLQRGSSLSRVELKVSLNGENAVANTDTAYIIDGDQLVDTTTFVDHVSSDTFSDQMIKGVAYGKSKGVFQGQILVRRDSQRIEGNQLHKALLMSKDAEIDCKPALEIYADDVKCSHGATVGELDDDQLFYLRARGIDEETARSLLVEAFLDDVVARISNDAVRGAFSDVLLGNMNK